MSRTANVALCSVLIASTCDFFFFNSYKQLYLLLSRGFYEYIPEPSFTHLTTSSPLPPVSTMDWMRSEGDLTQMGGKMFRVPKGLVQMVSLIFVHHHNTLAYRARTLEQAPGA